MRSRRGERDERGAILPITVMLMAATMALASFVIDIGGDRVVLRDMQSVADVVALDLARNLDGRTAAGYPGWGDPASLFAAKKAASVERQGGLFAEPDAVTARLAVANQQTGDFIRWAGADDIPNAVRVWASGSSAFRIRPATPESTALQRSALAVIGQPIVCISAGATLAELTDNPGGPLDVLLGRLINLGQLSAVGPGGVADLDAQIPFGDLATELGVGTVDEVADLTVSGEDLLVAAATVLSNNGDLAGANVLNLIAGNLSGATSFNLGEILALDTGTGSAADLELDAFSLAQAVIMVSNKERFVDLALPVSVPGLDVELRAQVIQAPQIACGRVGTVARSAQVEVELTGDLLGGLLSGLVTSVKIDSLLLEAARGSGTVTNITCSVTGSTVAVNAASDAAGLNEFHLDVELVGGLVELTVDLPQAPIGSSASGTMTFDFPAGSTTLPPAQTVGGSGLTLGLAGLEPDVNIESGLLTLLGLNLGSLISGTIVPLLGVIDTAVTPLLTGPDGVLTSLGVRLGTVEIRPTTRPACNEPVLRD